jgi:hypothetical protein
MQMIEDDPHYQTPAEERIQLVKDELADAEEHIGKLESALNEIHDMFSDEMDCDTPPGEAPVPNQAMRICMLIEEALKR